MTSIYLHRVFWRDALERGIRAFASSSLGVLGANVGGLANIDVTAWLSVSGMAVLMSLLFSLTAGKVGDDSAGFVAR
jgi:hypothetical protein